MRLKSSIATHAAAVIAPVEAANVKPIESAIGGHGGIFALTPFHRATPTGRDVIADPGVDEAFTYERLATTVTVLSSLTSHFTVSSNVAVAPEYKNALARVDEI